MPEVIAMRMPMPTVMGMPMTMCTGTYTIGKHAVGARADLLKYEVLTIFWLNK